MINVANLIGQTFNRWTVIGKSSKKNYVICKCSCGTVKDVFRINVLNGMSQSCGCLKHDTHSRLTHGHTTTAGITSEYRSWVNMLTRCRNVGNKSYLEYGARGITVCDRWLDFENFISDMGLKPTIKHQIERIDNDGNYELSNCRWATCKEQCPNRRNTRKFTFNGEEMIMSDWARRFNVTDGMLHLYLKQHNNDFEFVANNVIPNLKRRPYMKGKKRL